MDITDTDLLQRGDRFTLYEGQHIHDFDWLPFARLATEYFYPGFLKKSIFSLPEHLEIRAEFE